jgi:hypothetical protein
MVAGGLAASGLPVLLGVSGVGGLVVGTLTRSRCSVLVPVVASGLAWAIRDAVAGGSLVDLPFWFLPVAAVFSALPGVVAAIIGAWIARGS